MDDPLLQRFASRGSLSEAQVDDVLLRYRERGGSLDTAILESGAIDEPALLRALSEVSGVPSIQLADYEPNLEVVALLPLRIAERLGTVPLSLEGVKLHLACTYPVQENDFREIGFLLNKKLELWIALEVRVRDWISALYQKSLSERFIAALSRIDPDRAKLPRHGPPQNSRAPSPIEEQLSRRAQQSTFRNAFGGTNAASALAAWNEGRTLEEVLSQEAVEDIARNVALEPIPLQVKKLPERGPELASGFAPALASPPAPLTKPEVNGNALDELAIPRAASVPNSPAVKRPPSSTARPAGIATPAADVPAVAPKQNGHAPEPSPASVESAAIDEELAAQWTLDTARTALGGVTLDRDGIIQVALRYGRQTFDFVAAFALVKGNAVGWAAKGETAERFSEAKVLIPLDSASVFRTVALTKSSYVGPLPGDALTKHFLELFQRFPRSVFLFPVVVTSRVAAIIYGDCGQKPISQRRLSNYLLFCQELATAFEQLILFRKQRFGVDQSAALQSDEAWNSAASFAWSPAAPALELQGARGRAATLELTSTSESERPPPDFAPILKRLIGPDAAARARALADFACSPEASSRFLAANFPGPTAWSRGPVVDLPQPEELGPLPGALARLGRPGAAALAPLFDAADLDTRYFALLTAGSLPFPELVDGVLRALFDPEPDISSAARAAAAALRALPRFEASMKDLRRKLAAREPLRRALAARALGVLHDRESIDELIGLTGSDDQLCAQAAAGALREITKASFGTRQRQWSEWWAENRDRRRVEWLIAGLCHQELDLRLAAIEELSRAINDNLGYFADGPEKERALAIHKWLQASRKSERLQSLD